jgi:hypothetical protein
MDEFIGNLQIVLPVLGSTPSGCERRSRWLLSLPPQRHRPSSGS